MIEIFGSYAHGENEQNSDLDILIDFEQDVNLCGNKRIKN